MTTMFGNFAYPDQPASCPQCGTSTSSRLPFCQLCKFDLRHGSLGNSKKGICIYCKKAGLLSDEHIFPKWLQHRFPKRHSKTAHLLARPEQAKSPELAEMQNTTALRSADPYDAKVRNVCQDCNNGWMSALQILAKPLLEEHALGNLRAASPEERFVLARWTAMTSISLQGYGRQLISTEHQRSELMKGSMPPGWRTSRGVMMDEGFAGLSLCRAAYAPFQLEEGQYLPINMSLIVIERAIFQSFCTWGDMALTYAVDLSGFGIQALPMQPIWPLEIDWDNVSGSALNDSTLAAIPDFRTVLRPQ